MGLFDILFRTKCQGRSFAAVPEEFYQACSADSHQRKSWIFCTMVKLWL